MSTDKDKAISEIIAEFQEKKDEIDAARTAALIPLRDAYEAKQRELEKAYNKAFDSAARTFKDQHDALYVMYSLKINAIRRDT
jgi:hypothetical protein